MRMLPRRFPSERPGLALFLLLTPFETSRCLGPAGSDRQIMQPFPHRYVVRARSEWGGDVIVDADGLPSLVTDTPREFGGPGNRWSPEALFVAAVADCFVLTFRGIARVRGLAWQEVGCEVEGTLDRIDRVTAFTDIHVKARLTVPAGTSRELARTVLERAEETCLVARSLKARAHLETEVEVEPAVELVPVDTW